MLSRPYLRQFEQQAGSGRPDLLDRRAPPGLPRLGNHYCCTTPGLNRSEVGPTVRCPGVADFGREPMEERRLPLRLS